MRDAGHDGRRRRNYKASCPRCGRLHDISITFDLTDGLLPTQALRGVQSTLRRRGENVTHTPADAVPVACASRFRSRAPNVVSAERAHRRRSLSARPQIAGQSIRRNCVPN